MPVYSIQRDPPWIPRLDKAAPTKPSLQTAAPTSVQDVSASCSNPSYHASYHAHPQQQIRDGGPQLRQSRLPLFKHVRSMLHKPPPITTPSNPKWNQLNRGRSDSAHADGEASAYVSPYDGAFKSGRRRSPRKDHSPVSVLNDEDLAPMEHVDPEIVQDDERSPVSPVSAPSLAEDISDDDLDMNLIPEPLSPNIQRAPIPLGPRTPPNLTQIRRKPVSRDFSVENYPPQHSRSPSGELDSSPPEPIGLDHAIKTSHFSWTTCATSVAPGRPSIDTMAMRLNDEAGEMSHSRFSWSTVATNTTLRARPETPPPELPPIPPEHTASPPVQSILSRRRPIQRVEKEEWNPPAPPIRSSNRPTVATQLESTMPTSATTLKAISIPKTQSPTNGSPTTDKALPPPPQLHAANNLNHMETLIAQERDIVLQRRNVERGINELVKIEKASPLDVPFTMVRDAKKRLAEYRARLDEVRLEERSIGIAIARARRREELENGGDGETLWVRRVTG